jgi:hypothetical protein
VLIGITTVLATSFIIAGVTALPSGDYRSWTFFVGYGLFFAGVVCVVLAVPMTAIWVVIFASLAATKRSVRYRATLTTSIVTAIGFALFNLVVGQIAGEPLALLKLMLPWAAVPILIATFLAWWAFRQEDQLDGA